MSWCKLCISKGFPGGLVGKESACNAGDPGSIPGWESSPGEGPGYPLQHSWASLVAQLVKNPPAMWETWVQSLGWEDPLEESWQPTPAFLPGDSSWTEEPGYSPWGCKELDTTERLSTAQPHVRGSVCRLSVLLRWACCISFPDITPLESY